MDSGTIALIHAMFAESGTGGYDEPGVVCPFCSPARREHSHTHLQRVRSYKGNDKYEASQHYAIGVRGNVTVLEFWCEEGGHRWVLVFGEHKGGILTKIVAIEGDSAEDAPEGAGSNGNGDD